MTTKSIDGVTPEEWDKANVEYLKNTKPIATQIDDYEHHPCYYDTERNKPLKKLSDGANGTSGEDLTWDNWRPQRDFG